MSNQTSPKKIIIYTTDYYALNGVASLLGDGGSHLIKYTILYARAYNEIKEYLKSGVIDCVVYLHHDHISMRGSLDIIQWTWLHQQRCKQIVITDCLIDVFHSIRNSIPVLRVFPLKSPVSHIQHVVLSFDNKYLNIQYQPVILNDGQARVLLKLSKGSTPQEISRSLGIPEKKISAYKRTIFKKTRTENNRQMMCLYSIAREFVHFNVMVQR